MKDKNQRVCIECGSVLVETGKSTKQSGNPLYPITITQYRCTNDACQAASDKKQADALQQRLDRIERSNIAKKKFLDKSQ
ncbi:MAG: hypothetical protein C4584_00615 [Armatimonadetes bacterium]|nr:MAG: hypothetical protein C4584_00615 [Armatimonadota bacterium]